MAGEINFGILDTGSPGRIANSLYEGQQMAQNRELNAMKLQQARQDMEDQNALRRVMAQSGGDLQKASQALMQSGQYKPALEMQAQLAAQQKAKTDLALNHAKLIKDRANFVYANPTLQNAVSSLQEVGSQTGADVSGELSRLQSIGDNPEAIKQWAAGHAIEADKLIPKIQSMNLGGMESLARIDPLTGKIVSQQNFRKTMTPGEAANLAQSERHFQATQNAPTFNAEAGGFVVKPTAQNPQGGIIPLSGFGGKPLTEVQAKGVGFATRAKSADQIIENIGEQGKIQPGLIKRSVESIPLIGESAGTMANFTQSPKQQQIEQAQRDFINAILRQESGAAISQGEFDNAKKQYFPQPGDSKQVIQQKAQNRANAIQSLEIQAGPGMQRVKPSGLQIGNVQDGYVYQGGDPSKPSSWKKK